MLQSVALPFFKMAIISLQETIRRFEALRGKEIEFAKQALQSTNNFTMGLVANQLSHDIMSDGNKSGYEYAELTIAIKGHQVARGLFSRPPFYDASLSRVTDHLTNYDTGESYNNMYMQVKDNVIEFGTATDKEKAISIRMKGNAFKPTAENRERIIEEKANPEFIRLIREFVKM